ncbi:MAG: glycosyltransferase family 87 protein [Candidatus Binataceae bacterium]
MSLLAAAHAIADRHPKLIRAAAIALAVLSLSLVASTLYKNRGRFERADFDLYYHWWLEYRVGIDPWRPMLGAGAAKIRTATYCNYTPAFVMLLSPMAAFKVHTAYWIWLAIQIAALALAIAMLARRIRPPPSADIMVAIVALALLFPQVHATLYEAQFTFILLLILAAAWVLDRNGRPAIAGLMLALAALLKIYPATMGGLFLFRRRFRPIVWAAIFAVLGILATGLGNWREYFVFGVPVFNTPHWLAQPRAVAIWCNVYSALLKLRGGVAPSGFGLPAMGLTAILDLAVIAGAAAVTLNAPDDPETDGLCFGLWLAVALLISPVTWLHELPLLLPLYLFAGALMLRGRIDQRAGFWLLAIGLIGFVATYFWVPLREMRLYFIMTVATYIGACMLVASRSPRGRAVQRPAIKPTPETAAGTTADVDAAVR